MDKQKRKFKSIRAINKQARKKAKKLFDRISEQMASTSEVNGQSTSQQSEIEIENVLRPKENIMDHSTNFRKIKATKSMFTKNVSKVLQHEPTIPQVVTEEFDYLPSDTQYSESSEDSDNEESKSMKESLADWAIQYGHSHVSVTALLKILSDHHSDLPKDARTLLGTSRSINIESRCGGSFYNFGVLASFRPFLQLIRPKLSEGMSLQLQLNTDGVPLFKSSGMQLWPILGIILGFDAKDPVVVGIFCGTSKPSNSDDFFQDFVSEMMDLQSGFNFDGLSLRLKISSVCCDTPARAFVKNTKGHSGFHACEKCIQHGERLKNRTTYPKSDCKLRTDQDFINMVDEDHHLGDNLVKLSTLCIGMVTSFPLDYMHVVCLGVVRRLVRSWMKAPFPLRVRLPSILIEQMSGRLIGLQNFLPKEFARKPRSFKDVDRWKATEYRQLLLYTGPLFLHEYVHKSVYQNFMLLSVAIRILCSPRYYIKFNAEAQQLLINFVKHFGQVYGEEFLVYNLHALIHLPTDCKLHGTLDQFSCFPYENYLKTLKKMVRRPLNPLPQIVRRVFEARNLLAKPVMVPDLIVPPILNKKYHSGSQHLDLVILREYKEATIEKVVISIFNGDNCIVIGEDIVLVRNIIENDDGIFIVYEKFLKKESFFDYPLDSKILDIFKVSKLSGTYDVIPIPSSVKKCVCIPVLKSSNVFSIFPLLHLQSR